MRKLMGTIAALASVAALAMGAAGSAQAQGTSDQYSAQARAAGLTKDQARTLQAEVDREIAITGGKQVAANRVVWDGGETLLALPGESSARDLTAAGATVHRCPYYALCTYYGTNYTGTMHIMKQCREYSLPYYFYSWVNNQSSGYRAVFRNTSGGEPILITARPVSMDPDSGSVIARDANFAKPCNNHV